MTQLASGASNGTLCGKAGCTHGKWRQDASFCLLAGCSWLNAACQCFLRVWQRSHCGPLTAPQGGKCHHVSCDLWLHWLYWLGLI